MAFVGYPEILLAIIFFLFLGGFCSKKGVPWNWPILGMFGGLLFHVHRVHEESARILEITGCTFLFKGPWFSNMDLLGTTDPANIHYIMSSHFSNFPKGPEFKRIFEFLGDGIFNADGESWRNQRRLGQSMISNPRFLRFLAKVVRAKMTEGLVPVLDHAAEQGGAVDLQDVFQRLTFDTTCMLVTGFDTKCLSIDFPEVPFAAALEDVEEAVLFRHALPETLWKLLRWLRIGKEGKLMKGWKVLDETIDNYISMKRKQLTERAAGGDDDGAADLLTSYMTDEGISRDGKFLRDTVLNFMIAGRDTVSSALTWFFYLVSDNPSVESKIREEIESTIPEKHDRKSRYMFSTEGLNKLVYLHAAMAEALRLYPPVPFQHKCPVQPDVLPSGHKVDPHMKILFPLYGMGRMTAVWGKDCSEFKPERWISEGGKIKHEPSYKFLSFNAGPRTCIGKEVAFTQMKAVAATIIHNYSIEMVKGHSVAPNVSIILYMQNGFKVRVKKRWD